LGRKISELSKNIWPDHDIELFRRGEITGACGAKAPAKSHYLALVVPHSTPGNGVPAAPRANLAGVSSPRLPRLPHACFLFRLAFHANLLGHTCSVLVFSEETFSSLEVLSVTKQKWIFRLFPVKSAKKF
jgi:hypothetical protein